MSRIEEVHCVGCFLFRREEAEIIGCAPYPGCCSPLLSLPVPGHSFVSRCWHCAAIVSGLLSLICLLLTMRGDSEIHSGIVKRVAVNVIDCQRATCLDIVGSLLPSLLVKGGLRCVDDLEVARFELKCFNSSPISNSHSGSFSDDVLSSGTWDGHRSLKCSSISVRAISSESGPSSC